MTKRTDFKPPEVLDFRRDDRRELSTIITVHADYKGHTWICAGDVNITQRTDQHGLWTIDARGYGFTDFEHDTVVLFRFGLAGAAFRMASGGRVWIDGFIAGDEPEAFRVPKPGWKQLEGAIKCKDPRCLARGLAESHNIVDEGKYIPPPNFELFDALRGLQVQIVTGRVV